MALTYEGGSTAGLYRDDVTGENYMAMASRDGDFALFRVRINGAEHQGQDLIMITDPATIAKLGREINLLHGEDVTPTFGDQTVM